MHQLEILKLKNTIFEIKKLTVDSAIKRMKFCHLQEHGWTWRVLCLVK